MYAHVHVRTMYLKYAPYDWLKYRGMAILVCRKKNRAPATFECSGRAKSQHPDSPTDLLESNFPVANRRSSKRDRQPPTAVDDVKINIRIILGS